jgi:transposase
VKTFKIVRKRNEASELPVDLGVRISQSGQAEHPALQRSHRLTTGATLDERPVRVLPGGMGLIGISGHLSKGEYDVHTDGRDNETRRTRGQFDDAFKAQRSDWSWTTAKASAR